MSGSLWFCGGPGDTQFPWKGSLGAPTPLPFGTAKSCISPYPACIWLALFPSLFFFKVPPDNLSAQLSAPQGYLWWFPAESRGFVTSSHILCDQTPEQLAGRRDAPIKITGLSGPGWLRRPPGGCWDATSSLPGNLPQGLVSSLRAASTRLAPESCRSSCCTCTC